MELGLGNYAAALESIRAVLENDRPFAGPPPFADAIEAAIRAGDAATGARILEAFIPRAHASGTHLALGLLARSRALLADDEAADGLYRESTEHLRQTRSAPELARTHLLYGEWLRRRRRRIDARAHLRRAHELFQSFGATFFAERARDELLATGERARQRSVETQDELTPQESRIAYMAADGASNPEIASRLFITASTVEYHLRKVYDKLAVNSRVQLAKALPAA